MPETRGQKRKRDFNQLWDDLMKIDELVEKFNKTYPDREYTVIKK